MLDLDLHIKWAPHDSEFNWLVSASTRVFGQRSREEGEERQGENGREQTRSRQGAGSRARAQHLWIQAPFPGNMEHLDVVVTCLELCQNQCHMPQRLTPREGNQKTSMTTSAHYERKQWPFWLHFISRGLGNGYDWVVNVFFPHIRDHLCGGPIPLSPNCTIL